MKVRHVCALGVVLSALILAVSCSSGPEPPKVGSPEYYWSAAKETYAAGDYLKTEQHLAALCKTDSQLTARGIAWYLVLTAGMSKGYAELADNFEYGAKANRFNSTAFRRQVNDFRTIASRLALAFAEKYEKFESTYKDPKVTLDFALPQGSVIPSPQLSKIADGLMPQAAILEDTRRNHLQTALLVTITRVVGAPEDMAKTQDTFKGGKAEIPREVFMAEMANILHEDALMYGRTKLDDPKRMEYFANHAQDALKEAGDTKETKALGAKIQKTLKLVKTQK